MPRPDTPGRAIVLDWPARSLIRLRVHPPRIGGAGAIDPADRTFSCPLDASRAAGELSVAHGWPIIPPAA